MTVGNDAVSLMSSGPAGGYQVNPSRGCGTKVKGGCYLEAASGAGGTLERLTWVLGRHVYGEDNLHVDAPARSIQLINPAATLFVGEVVTLDAGYDPATDPGLQAADLEEYERLVGLVGIKGLLDHVGKSAYTPWSFVDEVYRLGPSRKVSQGFMKQIAPDLPLPVFFSHMDLPVFDMRRVDILEEAEALLGSWPYPADHKPHYGNSWILPGWGMDVFRQTAGEEHWIVPVLPALDRLDMLLKLGKDSKGEAGWTPDKALAECPYLMEAERFEVIYCASWFTRGAYALEDDDDPGLDHENVVNLDLEAGEVRW